MIASLHIQYVKFAFALHLHLPILKSLGAVSSHCYACNVEIVALFRIALVRFDLNSEMEHHKMEIASQTAAALSRHGT